MPFDVVFLGTGCSSRTPIMGHTLRDRNGVWCSVCNTARLNIQKGNDSAACFKFQKINSAHKTHILFLNIFC